MSSENFIVHLIHLFEKTEKNQPSSAKLPLFNSTDCFSQAQRSPLGHFVSFRGAAFVVGELSDLRL